MRLGLLETGRVNPALVDQHGLYPDMFIRLLTPAAPEMAFRTYSVTEGALPEAPEECDAWLVTGSKFGAYDPEPWIPPLEDFLRRAYAAGAPIIGICFGHQILAQALGGKVVKSERGWGCGVHDYTFTPPRWMTGARMRLTLHAMHQDQVVEAPEEARLIASSAFCPNAAFVYGDPERPRAISVQPHPEFEADFLRDLIGVRRGNGIPEPVADAALAGLGAPVMNAETAGWLTAYLRRALSSEGAPA